MERAEAWARDEFGTTQLGDVRRTARLVAMAREAAKHPAGRVSRVFKRAADRQGAYDFLESEHVDGGAILDAVVAATWRRAAKYPYVFVPLDGTSLNLTDLNEAKGFGSVGSRARGARGLKAIDAIAVAPDGVPLGVAGIEWWARGEQSPTKHAKRPPAQKEIHHWGNAIDAIVHSLSKTAKRTRAWFQIDREGDAQHVLEKLVESGALFTVRSQANRRLSRTGTTLPHAGRCAAPRRRYLRSYLQRQPAVRRGFLDVPGRDGEPTRRARVVVRAASVILYLTDKRTSIRTTMPVNAVWVHEESQRAANPEPERQVIRTRARLDAVDQSPDRNGR